MSAGMRAILFVTLALALVAVPAMAVPTASAINPLCALLDEPPLHDCLPECKFGPDGAITCERWP